MNKNSSNLEEAKKLNQQAASKASQSNSQYEMEAGVDYDLMEAKKLNEKAKNKATSQTSSSSGSPANQ